MNSACYNATGGPSVQRTLECFNCCLSLVLLKIIWKDAASWNSPFILHRMSSLCGVSVHYSTTALSTLKAIRSVAAFTVLAIDSVGFGTEIPCLKYSRWTTPQHYWTQCAHPYCANPCAAQSTFFGACEVSMKVVRTRLQFSQLSHAHGAWRSRCEPDSTPSFLPWRKRCGVDIEKKR